MTAHGVSISPLCLLCINPVPLQVSRMARRINTGVAELAAMPLRGMSRQQEVSEMHLPLCSMVWQILKQSVSSGTHAQHRQQGLCARCYPGVATGQQHQVAWRVPAIAAQDMC